MGAFLEGQKLLRKETTCCLRKTSAIRLLWKHKSLFSLTYSTTPMHGSHYNTHLCFVFVIDKLWVALHFSLNIQMNYTLWRYCLLEYWAEE